MEGDGKTTKKREFEDFITSAPNTVMAIDDEQTELIGEHSQILIALLGKNMTVKEIHRLFLEDPEGPSYSKTLKTVYRHLDILEKSGLVKLAGHRKYEGSRQTEKLYCRAAQVYFQRDARGPKWWETEEGRNRIQKTSELVAKFFALPDKSIKHFSSLLERHYAAWNQTVMKLFEETANNSELADIFKDVGLSDIKDLARIVGLMGVLLEEPKLMNEFRQLLTT